MQIINLKKSNLIKEIYSCEEKNFFGSESYSLFQIKKILDDDNYFSIGIMSKDIFLGYFFAKKISKEEFEIEKIFIKEEARKNKFGSLLLNYFFETLKPKNIFLEVRENNSIAISFYIKNGFKKISIRKNYYSDGETAFVLKKEVD